MRTAISRFSIKTIASTLPSWRVGLSNTAIAINSANGFSGNLTLASVDPCPGNNCSYSRNSGQAFITVAWCGGFATANGIGIAAAGGHSAYGGAETYYNDLFSENPQWVRVDEPIDQPNPAETPMPPDNGTRPNARHTYQHTAYHAALNKIMLTESAALGTGSGNNALNCYGMDVATWTWDVPSTYDDSPTGNRQGNTAVAIYDPVSELIFYAAGGTADFWSFDPSAASGSQWTFLSATGTIGLNRCVGLDPARRLFITYGMFSVETRVDMYHNESPYEYVTGITTSGTAPTGMGEQGMDYDPIRDEFVLWKGGNTLYTLKPPAGTAEDNWSLWSTGTWEWGSQTLGGDTVTTAPKTYNRFRYVSAIDAFASVNTTSEPTYVMVR